MLAEDRSNGKLIYNKKFITSINVRTAKSDLRLRQITQIMHDKNLGILLLQETRRCSETINIDIENKSYTCYFSGDKEDNRFHGVGAITEDNFCKVLDIQRISNRIIILKLSINNFRIRIINLYSPTDVDSKEINTNRAKFYQQLQDVYEEKTVKMPTIITGDLNCNLKLKNLSKIDGFSKSPSDLKSQNAIFLKSYITKNSLCLPATFYRHKFKHRFTHTMTRKSSTGELYQVERVIDHFLCSNAFRKLYVTDTRVFSSLDFESDHRPLTLILKLPTNKASRKALKRRKNQKIQESPDLSKLQSSPIKKKFLSAIENNIPKKIDHQSICNTLEDAVTVLPKKSTNRKFHPWDDDELLQKTHANKMNARKTGNKEMISVTSKIFKNRLKIARNNYF